MTSKSKSASSPTDTPTEVITAPLPVPVLPASDSRALLTAVVVAAVLGLALTVVLAAYQRTIGTQVDLASAVMLALLFAAVVGGTIHSRLSRPDRPSGRRLRAFLSFTVPGVMATIFLELALVHLRAAIAGPTQAQLLPFALFAGTGLYFAFRMVAHLRRFTGT
ncbi:hypothetical protein [Deinococcus soli (ex Cha et al. 2016)]|uniref:Membrane protein implicated in regulation of membrane protease activity n=2 Tax=Deinococcus soli (ex Cha et al. 2016) TaxID=1309411 RepID=A0ACC6KG13_9DEIO|nr:hypothetical protein [Deinococcus soli (ex Cha et al. 2016)]MDR6218345.1 membrane protein implicated in regulation of membrane protease activity [Deinococcus soli (ex Cha et al. 2016)]MDR6329085.1 membrane protein implicated in regulation of membrane protease activity [Deinococcus soli (ex Cha et al. 2016)]MDR6751358.1 membrane protein implicated in regulation of membrane protease activity [Deinococcus soli (ex Cha et al. 2016)]